MIRLAHLFFFAQMPATTAPALSAPPASGLPGALPGGGQDMQDLRDILPPMDVPFWTPATTAIAVCTSILVIAVIAFAAWRWHKRVGPIPPPPDPRRVALEALQRLSGAEGEALSALEFVVAVAEILRRFLEARHEMPASRQTTEEFLDNLERSNQFTAVVQEQLRRFLGRCDAVKFAAVDANAEVRSGLVFETVKLVKEDLA